MNSWIFTIFVILSSISALGASAFANSELLDSNATHLVIKAPLAEGHSAHITVSEVPEASAEKIQEQIQKIIRHSQTQNSDVLVSTDQEKILTTVAQSEAQSTSHLPDKRLVRYIPIGKLASASQKLASGFGAYYQRAKNTLMHDRIGLTVLTITVGYDTMIWIHSASFDIHQKTSMVLMNLVMAATFGLDRDLWTNITRPIKNKLIRVFDRFLVSDKLTVIKSMSSQFMANMLLGVALQSVRTGLLSLDHISDVVMTSNYWLTAIKIGGLISLTTFAWTETYGSIQAEKNPVAKMMLRRIGEMRGIILCQLASISMVLQPQIYGQTPIIAFVVHGSLGLIVLANADRIISFLESNKIVNQVYKKVQTFENFINESFQFNTKIKNNAGVVSCRSLLSTL